ncbi:MAG: winged helix-turn-helix domain-containing protein [Sinimarinibacterium flocculans]|uniref:winged helix-turn-helix domain-containing tetratricopeptide repeat protein n=1 Tax=Sinimarinibacterium flocculans TaxID=985250 RepID=UPI003C34ED90
MNTSQDSEGAGAAALWHFGRAEFDEGTFELRVDGRVLDVERKPLEVLLCLLRHGNEIVSKETILETVWPGRIVTESVLTKCIAKLRDALKDERQTLIRTQHRVGYRLTVPVRVEDSRAHAVEHLSAPESTFAVVPSAPAVEPVDAVVAPKAAQAARRPYLLGALVVAGVLAVGLAFALRDRAAPPPAEKSVAVLPFANLSDEADSAYFTEGLHDSILTHLALIQDLSVISRTSVMQYRNGDRNLRQIARALDVAHIVEGSVQRAGNRLLVTAQLIDTRTDSHLWAGQFDRSLSDVFTVQAGIAKQIAGAVHAQLTPEEQRRIERVPTTDTAAYEAYLRALEVERRSSSTRAEVEAAIGQLEQAVTRDPSFALAHALMSGLHDSLYWAGKDASDERRRQARESAEAALRIDPGLPEAHVAMGRYLYHGERDYGAAIKVLEHARELAPGGAEVPFWLGAIHRRQGRWQEAVASFARAAELDPRNEQVLMEYAFTLTALRRYDEADLVYARLEAFASRPEHIRLKRGTLQWIASGDLGPLERALDAFGDAAMTDCDLAMAHWELYVVRREFDAAAQAAMSCDDSAALASDAGGIPNTFFAAVARFWAGDEAAARTLFEQAGATLEARLRDRADEPAARLSLAHVLLVVGEREDAMAQAQRALDELPLSLDAVSGAFVMKMAIGFYSVAGETERALGLLRRSLEMPAGEHAHAARLNPVYDPLRSDPRFEALMVQHGA